MGCGGEAGELGGRWGVGGDPGMFPRQRMLVNRYARFAAPVLPRNTNTETIESRSGRERERESETEAETDRQTDKQRQRDRHTETHRDQRDNIPKAACVYVLTKPSDGRRFGIQVLKPRHASTFVIVTSTL